MKSDCLICVSVCAPTLDELIGRAIAAAGSADVIELRLDCLGSLNRESLRDAIADLRLAFSGRILATFRPANGGQGGACELSMSERLDFWRNAGGLADWCDLEADLAPYAAMIGAGRNFERVIWSFHEFDSVPDERGLGSIYGELRGSFFHGDPAGRERDVLKIAVRADDACDTIGIWKLLKRSRAEDVPLIPIAMGEAGKWARILGPAFGAFMTYASEGTGCETAPGQISAKDLRDVYRAGRLDEDTAVYGILAGSTRYSLSPFIHNAVFAASGMNAVFVPFQTADPAGFARRFVRPATREIDLKFGGFAVTNPHKETIIQELDEIDRAARAIGAVNTLKIEGGRLVGSNTDSEGFVQPLRRRFGDLAGARVAVFGAGGAARASVYALVREGAEVTVVARDPKRGAALAGEFGCRAGVPDAHHGVFEIVINATPLGTAGEDTDRSAIPAAFLKGLKLAYDLVYNPSETRFLREAIAAGAETLGGLEMLLAQATLQQEIWTGIRPQIETMRAAALARLASYEDRST